MVAWEEPPLLGLLAPFLAHLSAGAVDGGLQLKHSGLLKVASIDWC